jgi:hypothetical protein
MSQAPLHATRSAYPKRLASTSFSSNYLALKKRKGAPGADATLSSDASQYPSLDQELDITAGIWMPLGVLADGGGGCVDGKEENWGQ